MAIIKCKNCGGDMELSQDRTLGTCQYCGSTMTLPKIDDEQRAAAFNRGNHFRRIGEFDKALAVYERIVQEDDTDAEAHWCCALCRFGIEYVEDPATMEYLPTCHRASFDSFLEDVDYLAAVEHSDGVTRRQYQKDAAKIAEVQRGILATSQSQDPYDVFICYKESDENGSRTKDSALAQDIYYQLTEQGRKVFFARITLEEVAGSQYEPYIFAALHSAKVMIVVGTKPEYLNAVWVKNEWSRFLAMMKKDRHKLLLPCYRDMDPYDLPEQLSVLQSYDMSKIGFIQDLTRGVAKVLDADKKPAPVAAQAAAPAQSASPAEAQVKRGNMALEDGEWEKADEFFEAALNLDAESAEAYMGKLLAQEKKKTLEGYFQSVPEGVSVQPENRSAGQPDRVRVEKAADRYDLPGYLQAETIRQLYHFNLTYPAYFPTRDRARNAIKAGLENDKFLTRARSFAKGAYKTRLDEAYDACLKAMDAAVEKARQKDEKAKQAKLAEYSKYLDDADDRAAVRRKQAEEKREADYQAACKAQAEAKTAADYKKAADRFLTFGDYKDAADRSKQCKDSWEKLTAQEEAAENKRKRKINTIVITTVSVIAVVVVVALIITQVIIPGNAYRNAESLLAAGQYDEAAEAFAALGNYKDAAAQKLEAGNAKAYTNAEALLAAGKYDEAAEAFTALGDYKDAADRAKEAITTKNDLAYAEAEALFTAGKYGEAAVAFSSLGDYKDAANRATKARLANVYVRAETLMTEGKTVEAAMEYGKAIGYRDAKEKSFALWEDIAVRDTLSARSNYTVGLKANGTVLATAGDAHDLTKVSAWRDILAISAGDYHTVGLKADGTVVAAEKNDDGQCDVSGWTNIVAISAGYAHTVGLKADGTVVATGDNDYGQCNVSDWTNIVAISAGGDHTVGLKADGTVVATEYTGDNDYGQCDVSDWTDIVAISAGGAYTVGLKANGTVVAVGWDFFGQCNVSDWANIVAISAGGFHTVGLKADGTVVATEYTADNYYRGQCDVSGWMNIVAIAAGDIHTVGLKADGTVVAVGDNDDGQCEVSGWTNIKLPKRGS